MSTQIINGVFYDGDYTQPIACSGLETETPFSFQPGTNIFRQNFQQFLYHPGTGAAVWSALDMNSSPAASGMDPAIAFSNNPKTGRGPFLVQETPRRDVGAGIVEWTRVWANVPYAIYEFPAMNYGRQNYSVSTVPWSGQWDTQGNFHGIYRTFTAVEEWSEPLTGIVERLFVCIPSKKYTPAQIRKICVPKIPYRLVKIVDERGKEHVYELGAKGIAEPTSITPWMGDILEVRNVYVQPVNMGKEIGGGGTFFSNLPAWPNLNSAWQPVYL